MKRKKSIFIANRPITGGGKLAVKKVEDVQLNTDEEWCCIEKEHPLLNIKKQPDYLQSSATSWR